MQLRKSFPSSMMHTLWTKQKNSADAAAERETQKMESLFAISSIMKKNVCYTTGRALFTR